MLMTPLLESRCRTNSLAEATRLRAGVSLCGYHIEGDKTGKMCPSPPNRKAHCPIVTPCTSPPTMDMRLRSASHIHVQVGQEASSGEPMSVDILRVLLASMPGTTVAVILAPEGGVIPVQFFGHLTGVLSGDVHVKDIVVLLLMGGHWQVATLGGDLRVHGAHEVKSATPGHEHEVAYIACILAASGTDVDDWNQGSGVSVQEDCMLCGSCLAQNRYRQATGSR